MGTEFMQVDSTHITVDTKENPFMTYGENIFGNIIAYTSSDDEEEEKKKKRRRKRQRKRRV